MKFDKLTEAYMNVVAKQIKMHFANIKQIEDFLLKQNDGNLDNVWENIQDQYKRIEDPLLYTSMVVSAFNKYYAKNI